MDFNTDEEQLLLTCSCNFFSSFFPSSSNLCSSANMLSVMMLQSMLDMLPIPESAGLVLLVGGLSGLMPSAASVSFGLRGDILVQWGPPRFLLWLE